MNRRFQFSIGDALLATAVIAAVVATITNRQCLKSADCSAASDDDGLFGRKKPRGEFGCPISIRYATH